MRDWLPLVFGRVAEIGSRHANPLCMVLDPQTREEVLELISVIDNMAQILMAYEVALLREARRPQ